MTRVHSSRRRKQKPSATKSLVLIFVALLCFPLLIITWMLSGITKSQTIRGVSPASSSSSTGNSNFFNPLLRHLKLDVENIHSLLLKNNPTPSIFIEVGCHRLKQSIIAAQAGHTVYAFEPSPQNFAAMKRQHDKLPPDQKSLISIVNKAVSDTSDQTVEFSAIGGTGDHITGLTLDAANAKYEKSSTVSIPTVKLDDVIAPLGGVYYLKIDVQGYESHVFQGLRNSISKGRIRYILFEYWVEAIDQMDNQPRGSCSAIQSILLPLVKAGYQLFDLKTPSHPKSELKPDVADVFYRSLDFQRHCDWFLKMSDKARAKNNYTMGYWTDVLAVYKGDFEIFL